MEPNWDSSFVKWMWEDSNRNKSSTESCKLYNICARSHHISLLPKSRLLIKKKKDRNTESNPKKKATSFGYAYSQITMNSPYKDSWDFFVVTRMQFSCVHLYLPLFTKRKLCFDHSITFWHWILSKWMVEIRVGQNSVTNIF